MDFHVLKACALAAALAVPAPQAHAADAYPARPIRSIMTVAGGADTVARLVAQGLSVSLGRPVGVGPQRAPGARSARKTWRAPHPTATPSCSPRRAPW